MTEVLVAVAIYWVVAGWFTTEPCYKEVVIENVTVGNWSAENCKILDSVKDEA